MTSSDFYDNMNNKTTVELIDIIHNQREDYRPVAIEAAEQVIESREVSEERVNEIIEQLSVKETTSQTNNRRNIGLFSGPGIIVTIIVITPLLIVIQDRGWKETFLIALIGYGAGYFANYLYLERKK